MLFVILISIPELATALLIGAILLFGSLLGIVAIIYLSLLISWVKQRAGLDHR